MSLLTVRNILPSLEDQARSYFFTRYVPDSHFSYLPSIYAQTELAAPLRSCVQAVAVASFANERSSPNAMRKALQYYSHALRDINQVIQAPTAALLDGTIVSVLLLGLFEALMHSHQPKRTNENSSFNHNQGALALLELRGPEILKREMGFQVFIQVSSSIRLSCLQRQQRVPARLMKFHQRALPFLDPENPKVRLFPILDRFIELQARIAEDKLQYSLEVVVEAARLDGECQHLMSTIHAEQHYAYVVVDSEDHWAYGSIHQYPNGNVAQWWNSMRMTRIFLNKIIMHQLPPSDTVYVTCISGAQQAGAYTSPLPIITSMAAEICASVGQFIHEVEASKIERSRSQSNTAVMGLLSRLFWPLCAVGETETIPYPMKAFASRCLHYLGTEAGFPQAVEAAKLIENQNLDANW